MPVFKKKPEIVDARKFEGGIQNGTDLVFWVNSNEGKAMWEPKLNEAPNGQEYIRLYGMPYSVERRVVYPGDWIMRHQDGSFAVVRQQELDAEYEQV